MYQHIRYDVTDAIATITFDRPQQLNAMNRLMMDEIIDAILRMEADPLARVGLLTGNGKAFMAGADITEYAQQSNAEFEAFQANGRRLYAALEANAKPVIAAVNGFAFGGGFEIALACDMLVIAESAQCGLPEIRLNLIPGGGGTQRLPRKIGLNRANELLLSGRSVSARDLADWGCANHVFPDATFLADARQFAAQFTDKPPEAVRILKQLSQLAVGAFNPAAQAIENEALGRLYRSDEGQHSIQAFYQRHLERQQRKAQQQSQA